MALTVLQVGYPLAPTGPDAVGGAEQVLHLCDRAVTAAGHRSLVLAPEGSQVAGELIPLPAVPARLDEAAIERARRAAATELEALAAQVDVIHMHGVDFWSYLPPPGPPLLVTLHLPPSAYPRGALPPTRPGTWLVAVSRRQRAAFGADLPLLCVDNGVDLERHRPAEDEPVGDYVVALGRLCPEKGWDLAVEAARRAAVPLRLAGALYGYPAHEAWYESELRPRLDADRCVIGPVGGEAKRRLLAGARCLVVPSQVPETSCLVAMEALACGTPVVAWNTGALPDVVEHGRTGLLVRDLDGLVRALDEVRHLDRAACRAAAARFCASRTAERYLELYDAVAGAQPSEAEIELVDDVARLAELPWDDLHARSPGAGPFLRRAWLLPWAELFAPHLRCLALWRRGRLDGLLPLHLQGEALLPLGYPVSDRHGALLAGPDRFGDAARLLAAARDLRGWTRLQLSALPPGSPLRLAPVAAALEDRLEPDEVSPVLSHASGDPWRAVPRRKRKEIRRTLRLLEREGHTATWLLADDDTLESALDTLFALHTARWRRHGQPGVVADGRVREHLRRAARGLLSDGVLRLHVLHLDDRPAAAVLALHEDARLQCYLQGWSEDFARYGPSTLVLARAFRRAVDEGARAIDMLRGSERYKYAWGATDRHLHRRILSRDPP